MRDDDTHTQDQYDDHMQRIDQMNRDFMHGEITAAEKRRRIAAENSAYYHDTSIKPPKVRDEIAGVIADATGVQSRLRGWHSTRDGMLTPRPPTPKLSRTPGNSSPGVPRITIIT